MEKKLKEFLKNMKWKKEDNCPDDTLLVFYVEDRLNKDEKKLVEKHLKECHDCFNKVIELKETKYFYSISKKGFLLKFSDFFWPVFSYRVYVLAFACVFIAFISLLILGIKKEKLPLDPSSLVKIQTVDAAETIKTEFKGIIINGQGYIVTALNSIAGAKKILVKLNDGTMFEARELWIDRGRNIAIIKPYGLPQSVKPVEISDTIITGENAIIVPLIKGSPVSATVTDFRLPTTRSPKKESYFLQLISTKESQGDGIVIDRNGRLVAITSVREGKVIFAGLLKDAVNEIKNRKPVRVEKVKEEKKLAEALYYYFKGILATDAGRIDIAEKYFKKAIELDSQLEGAYLELAGIYYQKRLYDLEIEQYQKVLNINPENADALYFLALAYETKGWYEKAIQLYKKVIEIQPDDAEAIFNLGLAYLTVGERNKAMGIYHELKKYDPGFAEKLRRLSRGV